MKEYCQCGHLKECHLPHILDKNGGDCSHCNCKIYTWAGFLWDDNEVKERVEKVKGAEFNDKEKKKDRMEEDLKKMENQCLQ